MEPATLPPQPPVKPPASTKMTGRTKLALWLMIGPTALFIGAFLLLIIGNFIVSATATPAAAGELIATRSPVTTILNIFVFLAGAITVLTWLPGLITGIILLATAKK